MEAWAEQHVFAGLPEESGLDGLLFRVEAHFRDCIDGPEAVGALYTLCIESLTVVPERRPRLATYFQGYRHAFEHHIRCGQAKGEIQAGLDLAVEAAVVLGMIRSLVTQWLLDRNTIGLQVAMRAAPEGSVDVAYRRDYEAAENPAAQRQVLIDGIRARTGALRAAEGFGIDDVIDPRDTHARLIEVQDQVRDRQHGWLPPEKRAIPPI